MNVMETDTRAPELRERPGDDRAEWHLWNWARWMRGGSGSPRGFRSRASGARAASSREFDALAAEADTACAWATDAVVDALPALSKRAVYAAQLGDRWQGTDAELRECYEQTVPVVGKRLASRGIV
jgi:hypothetical protein